MPQGPQYLVLHTEPAIERLERLTRGYGTLFESLTDPERKTNIRELVAALAFQKDAREETAFTLLSILHDEYGPWMEAAMDNARRNDLMDVLSEFSQYIQHQLQQVRAYQNGYLYYHFFDWAGRDMILSRLEGLPEIV